MTTYQIRADVPISLHPDSLLGHAKVLDQPDTVGRTVLAVGREALTIAYGTYAAMQNAEMALLATAGPARRRQAPLNRGGGSDYQGDVRFIDGAVTRVHGHEGEYAEAAAKAFERTSRDLDRRSDELRRHREALAERVEQTLNDKTKKTPENLTVASEVRAHVKSLPANQRLSFLRKAIDQGDLRTVSAVLAGQGFLSGLTEERHKTVRDMAAQKFAPTDHAQLMATEAVIEKVMTAGQHLVGRYAKALERRNKVVEDARRKLGELAVVGRGSPTA